MRKFMWVKMWVNRPDPHRDPHAEMSGEGQKVPDRKFSLLPGVLFFVVVLHDLRHKIPHGFCRLILHLPGGMGVEGESSVVMPQHTADGFHVYAVLEGQSCERVPLWHNKDKPENPCGARSWRLVLILFPLKNSLEMGSTGGGDKRGLHLRDKSF